MTILRLSRLTAVCAVILIGTPLWAATDEGQAVRKVVKQDPAAQPSTTIPDTTAGKRAAAFIEAFNQGTDDAMRAFEQAHRAESALKARPIEARVKQIRELIERWGKLDIIDVQSSGDLDIVVMVIAERTGQQVELGFELEAQPPHKTIGVRIATFDRPRQAPESNEPLTAEQRTAIVNDIATALDQNYVYPDKGKKLAETLRANLATGAYDEITHPVLLANRLTGDLRDVCSDRHLAVRPEPAPTRAPEGDDDNDWWARGAKTNYGFERVERLPGNLGYLKLNLFEPGEAAQKVAAAAMNFLARTDALIIDLRDNGGGSPEMIAYLSGYLFDETVHLNSFYNRPTDDTSQTWSRDDVAGDRYGESKPVYVLTSHYTFSAAEEFTYNLKSMKRATIVGETTGGGAHPVMPVGVGERFTVYVPYARAINPITETNWEGVGVTPCVPAPAEQALLVAQKKALERLAGAGGDENAVPELRAALAAVEAQLPQRSELSGQAVE